MKRFKRLMGFLLALVIFLSTANPVLADRNSFTYYDEVSVIYAGDAESGRIFYSKNADKSLPVASMSKLMTYLVVMDDISSGKIKLDDIVTIDEDAVAYNKDGYSSFDTKLGEKISVENLIKGMMIVSGNDASIALAKHSAKTEKAFVEKMNTKAKELGLKASHFVNSTGITEVEEVVRDGKTVEEKSMNVMSAEDLFALSRHIVKNYPQVVELGKQTSLVLPERNFAGNATFPDLGIDGTEGLKTGFTYEAGYCLTGLFDMTRVKEGQNYKLITVVMGAETMEMRQKTTIETIDYVLNNYSIRTLANKDIAVTDYYDDSTSQKNIRLYPAKTIVGMVSNDENIDISYEIDRTKKAPYEDGEVMGKLILKQNEQVIETLDLVNRGYVPKLGLFSSFTRNIKTFLEKLMMLF